MMFSQMAALSLKVTIDKLLGSAVLNLVLYSILALLTSATTSLEQPWHWHGVCYFLWYL